MSLPTVNPGHKDAFARALLLVFAFSSWSLTAPANMALALLGVLWLTEVPRYWRPLSREPAAVLCVLTLLISILLAGRAAVLFPATAREQLQGLSAWMAPFLFIVPAWWLRRDPSQIMPMLAAAFLGLIFGVLHKTDWSLAPQILQGMRYHFGSAALGLSFIASVALTGFLIFRHRITHIRISGRSRPAIGWVLWGLGCGLLLTILTVTQSRGAALALGIAGIVYGILNGWPKLGKIEEIHGPQRQDYHHKELHYGGLQHQDLQHHSLRHQGLPASRFVTLLGMFLFGAFLLWTLHHRNIDDWRELTTTNPTSEQAATRQTAIPTASQPDREMSYTGSIAVRLNLMEVGLAAFVEQPWFGFGPGTSTTEFLVPQRIITVNPYHLRNAPNWSHLHSVPLEILARFGLVGILIALLLGRLFWRAYRKLWRDPRAAPDLRVFLTLSGVLLLFYFAYDFRLVNVDIRFFIIQLLGIVYSFSLSDLPLPTEPPPSSGLRWTEEVSAGRPPAGVTSIQASLETDLKANVSRPTSWE